MIWRVRGMRFFYNRPTIAIPCETTKAQALKPIVLLDTYCAKSSLCLSFGNDLRKGKFLSTPTTAKALATDFSL